MMNAGSTPGVLLLTATARYSSSTALMLVSRLGDLQPRSFSVPQVAGPSPVAHKHHASRDVRVNHYPIRTYACVHGRVGDVR